MRALLSPILLVLTVIPQSLLGDTSSHAPVRLNGWYKCNQRSFHQTRYGVEDDVEDDDDYVFDLTKKHKIHAPRITKKHAKLAFLDVSFEHVQHHHMFQEKRRHTSHSSNHHDNNHMKQEHHNHPQLKEEVLEYECGEFEVPMCYENICHSDKMISIFVKRKTARNADASVPEKTLWVLQGGPGASSTAMEGMMESLYNELDGKASIYTMDHRGTARSHRLQCEAAQASTGGSPGGASLKLKEVPACIEDVLFQIDNRTAAFSVTSAAMDLYTIISDHLSNSEVYVYGLSYGTYLVERLIHLAPESVKGYAVDGIVSEAGTTRMTRSTFSNWDRDVGFVAERFLQLCQDDKFCRSKFPKHANLVPFVKDLYVKLDEDAKSPGKNRCADLLHSVGKKPSYVLRSTFGEYLMSDPQRSYIPAIIHRVARCSPTDVDALSHFLKYQFAEEEEETNLDTILYSSDMLYNLIVFSEMWEFPSPDRKTLIKWYESATMASDNFYSLPYYCLFTGNREEACKSLPRHLPESKPFRYERDQYWNITAELPEGTTALLMNGGLDMQTRPMYGTLEYQQLVGDKMLVEFQYASHCTTFSTHMQSGGATCGVRILASFVKEGGVLEKVNTSCIDDVVPLDFKKPEEYAGYLLFGQSSLYGEGQHVLIVQGIEIYSSGVGRIDMDVPGWHPANEDSKKAANASTARTEYKVMEGSEADTSTDAGRHLLEEMVRGGDGGGAAYEGRGFFDTSDRLYLIEQKRLKQEKQTHQSREQEEALQEFRTGAKKAQAQKFSAVSVLSSSSNIKGAEVPKSTSAPIVLVKAKKRVAKEMESKKQKIKKNTQTNGEIIVKSSTKKTANSLKNSKSSAGAPVGLVHYSSSEEDE